MDEVSEVCLLVWISCLSNQEDYAAFNTGEASLKCFNLIRMFK